jgi:2,3-bisphosphoglycerate-independent phosphoglycerate mutase
VMARFTRKSVKILTTTKFNQSKQSKKGGNQKNHVISRVKGSAPVHSFLKTAIKYETIVLVENNLEFKGVRNENHQPI